MLSCGFAIPNRYTRYTTSMSGAKRKAARAAGSRKTNYVTHQHRAAALRDNAGPEQHPCLRTRHRLGQVRSVPRSRLRNPFLAPMPSAPASRLVPYLLLIIAALSFGGNWVVGRALQDAVPPFAMAFWRWLLALAILMPFAWTPLARDFPEMRRSWKLLFALGAAGVGGFAILSYWGLKFTAAINGALLNSSMPLFIITLSWAVLGLRVVARQSLGLLLSFTGVLCLISRGDPAVLLGLTMNVGDLMILAGMMCWSIYTVCLRWRPQSLHPMSFLFATILAGALLCFPLYVWEHASGERIRWDSGTAAGLLYLALFPSLIAFICWNHAVKTVGPNVAGLFLHLVPVFGTLFSMIFLGERLHWYHLGSALLVFAGIALTSWTPRPAAMRA